MWRYQLAQPLLTNKQSVAWWQSYQKLGTSSFLGIVMIITISFVKKTPAVATILTDWRSAASDSVLKGISNQGTTSHYVLEAEPSYLVADLPYTLPPTYFPANQGSVVNVPPVKRPERAIPSLPSSTTPATLPSTVFPTNQTPSVSVPSLQVIPAQTPTAVTTSQPIERSQENVSPTLSSSPVIEFGQPLPNIRPAVSGRTLYHPEP
jgi:hypothetical protein